MKRYDGSGRSTCPGRFNLLCAKAGELESIEAEQIARHVEACAACRAELEEIERVQAAFLETHSAEVIVANVVAEAGRRLTRRRRILTLVSAGAIIVIAFGIVFLLPRSPRHGIRTKGGPPALSFFVQRGDSAVPLPQCQPIRQADPATPKSDLGSADYAMAGTFRPPARRPPPARIATQPIGASLASHSDPQTSGRNVRVRVARTPGPLA